MSDFVTLSCPTCGYKLQVTNDIDRFACASCGNEHVVRRSGGMVSLAPVVQGLKQVQTGVDKTAAELAIQRISSDIAQLEEQIASYGGEIAQLNWVKKSERPEGWFDGILGQIGSLAMLFAIGSLIGVIAAGNFVGFSQSKQVLRCLFLLRAARLLA